MDAIAARPDIRADFILEPGEIAFWHNFKVRRSRTSFQAAEKKECLLFGLWLNVGHGRPTPFEIKERARSIDLDHSQRARLVPA